MKLYVPFVFSTYYPLGGADDLEGTNAFKSKEEAEQAITAAMKADSRSGQSNILEVDTDTLSCRMVK